MATRHPHGIAAIGSARRSTDLQERSIPDQKVYVEKWAGEHGYRIARWFVDDAISGTSTKGRNDFDRMIDAAESQSNCKRELEQLNRRIKTTVGMIADLQFDGIDDLRGVLSDLKKKRDALLTKICAHGAV